MRQIPSSKTEETQESPLHIAAANGNYQAFMRRLRFKEDELFLRNSANLTALDFLERKVKETWFNGSYKDIIELIISHLFKKLLMALKKDDATFSALLERIKETFPSILKTILEYSELNKCKLLMEAMPFASSAKATLRQSDFKRVVKDTLSRKGHHKNNINCFATPGLRPNRGVLCAKLLIEAGASINLQHPYTEEKLLHVVAEWGSTDMLELMLSNGAKANSYVLQRAVQGGNLKSAKLLLGAMPNIEPKWVGYILDSAFRNGSAELIELFYERLNPGHAANLLLSVAVKYHRTAYVKSAIERGASNINESLCGLVNRKFSSKYHINNVEIARLLINTCAHLNTRENNILSLILDKQGQGGAEIIKLLIESGTYMLPKRNTMVCITVRTKEIMEALNGPYGGLSREEKEKMDLLFKLAPLRMELFKLIENNDVKGLESLLLQVQKEFPVEYMPIFLSNSRNERGFTPLKEAKETNREDCVRILNSFHASEHHFVSIRMEPEPMVRPLPSAPEIEPLENSTTSATIVIENNNTGNIRAEKLKNLIDELRRRDLQVTKNQFFCHFTHEIMLDPVIAEDGYTYERVGITMYMESQKKKGFPFYGKYGQLIPSDRLIPNKDFQSLILEHCEGLIAADDLRLAATEENVLFPTPLRNIEPISSTENVNLSELKKISEIMREQGMIVSPKRASSSDEEKDSLLQDELLEQLESLEVLKEEKEMSAEPTL